MGRTHDYRCLTGIAIAKNNNLTNKIILEYTFSLWVSPTANVFFPGSLVVPLVHSQRRARKAERMGCPDEPGELLWHSRVPCEGV